MFSLILNFLCLQTLIRTFQVNVEKVFSCCCFSAHKPGTGSSGDGMAVERHPVSILNEYGQQKGIKVYSHQLQ